MPITITVPAVDAFDPATSTFTDLPAVELELEHSLSSLSKWEASFGKPFLVKDQKSTDEVIGYFQAMCLTPNVPRDVFERIDTELFKVINDYIDSKQTATWFREIPGQTQRNSREIVTAEVLFNWMIQMNVPMEFQHWHLNRLFTQLKVISQKNAPKKKVGRQDAMAQQRALNAQRRAQMNSSG
jgi:hypothetical protein